MEEGREGEKNGMGGKMGRKEKWRKGWGLVEERGRKGGRGREGRRKGGKEGGMKGKRGDEGGRKGVMIVGRGDGREEGRGMEDWRDGGRERGKGMRGRVEGRTGGKDEGRTGERWRKRGGEKADIHIDEIDVESTTENILSPYLYVESTTENIMLPYRLFDGGTHRSLLLAERAEHGTRCCYVQRARDTEDIELIKNKYKELVGHLIRRYLNKLGRSDKTVAVTTDHLEQLKLDIVKELYRRPTAL
ncbi:hypothetical protein LSAT2_024081 [Lamellibrachia satsuma]|nr:hypothetical protein LSAT2_024081 [Lamellibrachia satsuma]